MSGKRTILVGCDLRKPKIVKDFGIPNNIGVSTYLSNSETNLADIIIKSEDISNLDIIPSGPVPPNPAELIMSQRMDDLFNLLHDHYDFIVIDTPPVGLVTDASLISKYADLNIFVVRQNVSRIIHLNNIKNLYNEGKFKNVSILAF